MTNKEASTKQEKMVANYMGWKVVAGSGNRPFTPGDVNSTYFLIECKTHTTEQTSIVFHKNHWDKISMEANAKHRFPVLIVDNGVQKPENTWVAFPARAINCQTNKINETCNTSTSGNTITYNKEELNSLYRGNRIDEAFTILMEKFGNDKIAIMPLEDFREFYQQEYES